MACVPTPPSTLIDEVASGKSVGMAADVESLVHEYARRYSARDVEGVTRLCLWPFLA
jgi:hypothetical protein